MDALVVVDMQEGMREGAPKHDLEGVVERINALAVRVRDRGGIVCFVQHEGGEGDAFAPSMPGWKLLGSLARDPADLVVSKTLNDAFFGTALEAELRRREVSRVLVCGWATDLCVDSTIRSAVARGFEVIAVADAHTVSDRPELGAARVIAHHHWVWTNLLGAHPVKIAPAREL